MDRLPIPKVFLDLDGVLRNFTKKAIEFYKLDITPDDINNYEDIIKFAMERWKWKEVGDFWKYINADFFESCELMPWYELLLATVETFKPIILTSPPWGTAGGSQNWIQKNLPNFFYNRRYVITPYKASCADKNSILIDDSEEECKKFKANDGHVILFPAQYNKNREYKDKPVQYVQKELNWILQNFF